jgi:hypothetical protein
MFMRHNPLMHTSVPVYRRHRFTSEIISHCFGLRLSENGAQVLPDLCQTATFGEAS